MQAEIEAKFLDVDHQLIREKLKQLGGTCQIPMRTMRRTIFDYPDRRLEKNHCRLRVRDEGSKITITFKHPGDLQYQNEIETTVGSYDTTVSLLQAVGLQAYSVQETRRETWVLDGCEVVLDEWPWLKPYIEVEGSSEASIRRCVEKLGFDWADARYGSVEAAYREEYPGIKPDETVGEIGAISFDAALPSWLAERRTVS